MKQLDECGCQKPEGSMAKHDAMECAEDARAIADMIQDADNLPEWLEAKITLAADYMNRVKDYLSHHMNQHLHSMPGMGGDISQPQFVPSTDMKSHIIKLIPERIQKVEDGWAVLPSKGGKRLGTHTTRKAALKQLAAIEISKHRK